MTHSAVGGSLLRMINGLREDGAALYELSGEDFYKWIEARWRAWATAHAVPM